MSALLKSITATLAFSSCAALVASAAASPAFAPVFTDHAVLQRDGEVVIWGTADPGEEVTVSLGEARSMRKNVKTNADGEWEATLKLKGAGGPYKLTAKSKNGEQSLTDIMVGDVYLCSGQSNMEFQTRYATNAYSVMNAAGNDSLRLFTVPRRISLSPAKGFEEEPGWMVATASSVADFSAVCYFFGQQMQTAADVPVGLIASSWGGTIIEAWISDESLGEMPSLADKVELQRLARENQDEAKAQYKKSLLEWWYKTDPAMTASPAWYAADLKDSDWKPIATDNFWEFAGIRQLAQFDGLAWYRNHVVLTAEEAAQEATMTLGPIDDVDMTFVNGESIGATDGWDSPRTYTIPAGTLTEGDNVIAIGVLDTGGGGGLWGPAESKTLTFADGTSKSLADNWIVKISAPIRGLGAAPTSPVGGPNAYTVLYNGMIAPLAPYTLNGVLWYQGESNVNNASEYADLMKQWIADWRDTFRADDLPFFFVQLADFGPVAKNEPTESAWAELRQAQNEVAASDEWVGMAVTHDIGDRYDIHPTQKRVVAERLALIAKKMLLGQDLQASGPMPVSATLADGKVVVDFTEGPLATYGFNKAIGFEVCAENNCQYTDATVSVDGVVLDVPTDVTPDKIRFCWADSPVCNLYNDADLPTAPFEMDIQ
ncbi:sialate O-acetylesterase [Parvularcula sp. LCG005]|uniref:sialate O-acetylesterase n=1 Tax=Parvularcula sp. LCG005 TaxID=3078805 RepID=UPI002943330D|nr:sialate O-acetylesterase [Parvularcula sp. LCG005]WOI54792.1 sialate O-acetylesterase [Parvularcula sp. LCG005]